MFAREQLQEKQTVGLSETFLTPGQAPSLSGWFCLWKKLPWGRTQIGVVTAKIADDSNTGKKQYVLRQDTRGRSILVYYS